MCRCECAGHNEYHYRGKCIPEHDDDPNDYSNYSPFSEMGHCYSDTCTGNSLGQVSYAECCCEAGNRWVADVGFDECSICPDLDTSDRDDLCGATSLSQSVDASDYSSVVDIADLGACRTERQTFNDVTFEQCCCSTTLLPIEWGPDRQTCIGLRSREFYSQCPSGKGMLNGHDIDECEIFGSETICPGGACINQMSSFACTCQNEGYYWDEGSDFTNIPIFYKKKTLLLTVTYYD